MLPGPSARRHVQRWTSHVRTEYPTFFSARLYGDLCAVRILPCQPPCGVPLSAYVKAHGMRVETEEGWWESDAWNLRVSPIQATEKFYISCLKYIRTL